MLRLLVMIEDNDDHDSGLMRAELHRELGVALGPCGFRVESRHYNPHVTVARKIREVDRRIAFEPVAWRVDEFALIEVQAVENGVEYRVVETWALT